MLDSRDGDRGLIAAAGHSAGKAPHVTAPAKWTSLVQPVLTALLAFVNLYEALSSEARIGLTLVLAALMVARVYFARQPERPSSIVVPGAVKPAPRPHLYSVTSRRAAAIGFVLLIPYGVLFWLPVLWTPRLASVSPDLWVVGELATLRGERLCRSCTGEDPRVSLDGLALPIAAATPTRVVVSVPEQAKTGLLRIDSGAPWLPTSDRWSASLPVSVSRVEAALLIERVAVENGALLVRIAVVNRSPKQPITISDLELAVVSAEPGDVRNFQQADIDLGRFQVESAGPGSQASTAAPWQPTFALLGTSTLQLDPDKTDHVAMRLLPPRVTHSLKVRCALSALLRMPGGRLAAVQADRLISFTSDHLSGLQVADDGLR